MKGSYRPLIACACCVLLLLLVACNTTKGVGKDLEKAGEGIQDSADEHGAD